MAGNTLDLYTYAGEISVAGYEALCSAIATREGESALLVIATPGGDPHAGFRIARALQHAYGKFDALVPRYCKSAGTLILVGATKIYLDDRSELGPLDVQVKKGDELLGRNSGLDIFQAVNFLQNQAISTFRGYLHELARDGLSTKVGSEIAYRLTTRLLEPIAAQIDPIKLAEMQRATEIAFEYGVRLNEVSGILKSKGLQKLVTGYPSHGFVIDRKEARTIFQRVERPEGPLEQLSKALDAQMAQATNGQAPTVVRYTIPNPPAPQETSNANPPSPDPGTGSAAGSEPAINGDLPANDPVAQPTEPDTGRTDSGAANGTS